MAPRRILRKNQEILQVEELEAFLGHFCQKRLILFKQQTFLLVNEERRLNKKMIKNNKGVSTAIIYTRVSSKEQVEGFSLESQEKTCLTFAEKNGLEVLKIFKEEGESAKTADRTRLQEMIKYSEKNRGKVGKLLIYNVSRLARKVEDYSALKVLFSRYGVSIESVTERFGVDSSGKFMESVLAAVAEFDNNMKAEKTIEGMKTRLNNGLWGWKAPVGYKNFTNSAGNKIIVPDPEKGKLVRMLFEEYAKGIFSFKELARKANKLNLKSRNDKKMSPQLVVKILKNPIHWGMIDVPKWEIHQKGNHEALISEELFNKVQMVMKGINTRKMPRNRDNPDFLLRGVKCDGCGGSLTGGQVTGRTRRYAYYGCFNPQCSKRRALKKEDVENDFSKFLRDITPHVQNFDILKEAIKIAYRSEADLVVRNNEKIISELEKIKNQKDKILELKMREVLDDEEFKEEKMKLNERFRELELSKENLPVVDVDKVIEFSFNFLKVLPEKWKDLSPGDLRVLRSLLFPQNIEYSYPGFKTVELALIYKLNSDIEAKKECLVPPAGVEPALGR